jgi:hypothetical protein
MARFPQAKRRFLRSLFTLVDALLSSADGFASSTWISFAMHSGRLWHELSVRLQGLEAAEAKCHEITTVFICLKRLAPKATALTAKALD